VTIGGTAAKSWVGLAEKHSLSANRRAEPGQSQNRLREGAGQTTLRSMSIPPLTQGVLTTATHASYFPGTNATIRRGAPLPPLIFIGKATM
jgi:hypothetical protein